LRDLFSVKGKIVLVTGGSRGIGEMIAEAYVAGGARVYISSRKRSACDELAERLSDIGECFSLPADVSKDEDRTSLVAAMHARESRLDILINNAGATWGAPIDDYPTDAWAKVMQLNLTSPFFLIQGLLPLLRAAGRKEDPARVINVASINGLVPPAMETFAYSSSKAGLVMLTRHLAKRLARENILVNAIAPGPFPTKMMAGILASAGDAVADANPLGRIGQPSDIAGVALFLGAKASAYTTGATIPCDGGLAEV
jgi:NAD(P)-dependent dehydrogenase (short-subunit alcohol dehydrogenase family)